VEPSSSDFGASDWSWCPVVAEQDSQSSGILERGVGLLALLDRELMADQLLQTQRAGRCFLEEVGDEPALGPAHVADRVVMPALLVGRVVAARPVGARDPELELLFVEGSPRNVESDGADDGDGRAVARQRGRELHRSAVVRRGTDDNRVGAVAAAQVPDPIFEALLAEDERLARAQAPGELHAVDRCVDADRASSGSRDELSCDLTHQPQADDDHERAGVRLGQTNTVTRDRPESRECPNPLIELIGEAKT
jgi:hypothetical protein